MFIKSLYLFTSISIEFLLILSVKPNLERNQSINRFGNEHRTYNCSLEEWSRFKNKFKKTYITDTEDHRRHSIYCKTKQFISEYNLKNPQNSQLTLNGLSDLSQNEIRKLKSSLLAEYRQNSTTRNETQFSHILNGSHYPEYVNWADHKNIVGEIRDQGECGACWAFTTVGLIESRQHKQNKSLTDVIPLSAQQLVDCDYRSQGCKGGNIRNAYPYIASVGGLETEEDYPFTSETGHGYRCTFNSSKIHPSTRKLGDLEELNLGDNEELLQKILAIHGPIDISIEANEPFIYAGDEIIYDSSCVPYGRNHEVLLVGYGTNEQGDYWIIKNSWGKTWGRQGYGLMARNRNNNCNVASDAVILSD